MGEIREAKKAATRKALARAAAEIARDRGVEAMSIAAITMKVGVSQRTFHNYFDSKDDAIIEFAILCVDNLIDTITGLAQRDNLIDAVEEAVVKHLEVADEDLESFFSLKLMREQFDVYNKERRFDGVRELQQRVLEKTQALYPELSPLGVRVQLTAAASTAKLALDFYYSYHHDEGKQKAISLVHEAFAQLRR
ncbi:transcriptional regulator, TetR family [Corynebacterium mustelae]|uniref:Transcriptional regulator, TetR family n=1 Tax=Corynebacterium mustelae TaxID=571915 RepID=A0A0G3GW44_9CORY|nr:TetR family transcriptional regulator [Corynebacterium mustelae]AKK05379.1 transcriptional regulator, TetR family [Corynebacterium mustelae]